MGILDIINIPLGYIMKYCYLLVNSYGLAIVLFTIISKLLLSPLAVKQHKNTLKSLKFQPRLAEIQKKYKDDKEKLSREMQKLSEEGYNPAGGCLPLLIQFPIIIGLFNVIRSPLRYIANFSAETMQKIAEAIAEVPKYAGLRAGTQNYEILLIDALNNNVNNVRSLPGVENYVNLNLNMFGLNLAESPQTWFKILGIIPVPVFTGFVFLIPVLSGLTALLSGFISQKLSPAAVTSDPNNQAKSMQTSMLLIMPLMSYIFTMAVPAGVGLYWIISNLLVILQTIILNRVYNPVKYLEKIRAEEEDRKRRRKLAKQKLKEESSDD